MKILMVIGAFIFIGWLEIPQLLKKNIGMNLQPF